jgi:hypothetical protein
VEKLRMALQGGPAVYDRVEALATTIGATEEEIIEALQSAPLGDGR